MSCLQPYQRIWRGALGRMAAQRTRQRQLEEMNASVKVQRTYRGLLGKREARSVRDARNKKVAASFLVTRQARWTFSTLEWDNKMRLLNKCTRQNVDQMIWAATSLSVSMLLCTNQNRDFHRVNPVFHKVKLTPRGCCPLTVDFVVFYCRGFGSLAVTVGALYQTLRQVQARRNRGNGCRTLSLVSSSVDQVIQDNFSLTDGEAGKIDIHV